MRFLLYAGRERKSHCKFCLSFLNQDWRSINHEQIQRAASPFAGLLSALSQVMEEPITADSDRLMRERDQSRLDDLGSDPNIPASGISKSREIPLPSRSSPQNKNTYESISD